MKEDVLRALGAMIDKVLAYKPPKSKKKRKQVTSKKKRRSS
jgi:hypothetical protein